MAILTLKQAQSGHSYSITRAGLISLLLLGATLTTNLPAAESSAGGSDRGAGDNPARLTGPTGGSGSRAARALRANQTLINEFIQAAEAGDATKVQQLLTAGVDINSHASNYYRDTALTSAAAHGHTNVVRQLLAAGANVDEPVHQNVTALMLAAENGHLKTVQCLLAAQAQVNLLADNFGTALTAAALFGHIEIVQALLAAGADVNLRISTGLTALAAAAQKGHDAIVTLLLVAGADVNAYRSRAGGGTSYGASTLMEVINQGRFEIIPLLLAAGADVNVADNYGNTALTIAARYGNLAYYYTDRRIRDGDGDNGDHSDDSDSSDDIYDEINPREAHILATQIRNLGLGITEPSESRLSAEYLYEHYDRYDDVIQQLLRAGATLTPAQIAYLPAYARQRIEAQENLLSTQLTAAAETGDIESVQRLLIVPACQQQPGLFNHVLLLIAQNTALTNPQFSALVKLLSQHGADLNFAEIFETGVPAEAASKEAVAPPQTKLRALDLAIQQNQLGRVQALLKYGADPLLLADDTRERLAAFTLNTPVNKPSERAAELAAVKAQRLAELQSTTALSAAAHGQYLTDAFAIAQLMSDEIIKPSLEQRLMAEEDQRV